MVKVALWNLLSIYLSTKFLLLAKKDTSIETIILPFVISVLNSRHDNFSK